MIICWFMQAFDTLGKLEQVRRNVCMTLDKLDEIRADLKKTDDKFERIGF